MSLNQNQIDYDIMSYTTENGLPNNTIKAIVEDDNGLIWISSNRGISCINVADDVIRSFDLQDGLQSYEYNELSSIKMNDGTILFGGVNGFNRLDPNDIQVDTTHPTPTITDLKISNHSIYTKEELSHFIPSILNPSNGLTLKYNQNNIAFTFSGLHYSNSNRNQFDYWLEGFDTERRYTWGRTRDVEYTNIPAGRYQFHLRASNGDGIWSDKELVLPIVITPPFWGSWVAYVIYVILVLLISFAVARYYAFVVKRRNDIIRVKSEKNYAHKMLELRTRFFTNISHEFRTPLTLILSPLQTLIADPEINNDTKRGIMLKTMAHNGNSLMRLINELMDYAKQESGNLKVELKNDNFVDTANKLVDQFAFWAEQREIKLIRNISQTPIMMQYDRHLMEQIVYNIISNAIKHTPTGGTITIEVHERDSQLLIAVHDTGRGIDSAAQKHLFDRFYSLNPDNKSEAGGTGIGLSLSKSLVELHNGKIWFTSTHNEGTSFYVSIPIVVASEATNESYENDNSETTSILIEGAGERLRSIVAVEGEPRPSMLVVDDNPAILDLLSDIFSEYYDVTIASGGQEGIYRSLEIIPDIIITDVMMPGIDGLQLCTRIKGEPNTSHIPIIMLTAKSSEEDIIKGYRTKADAYCSKPFSNEVLLETVNSILVNRRTLAGRIIDQVESSIENRVINESSDVASQQESDQCMTTSLDKEFLDKMFAFIEDNIHNPNFAVTEICEKMGVSQLVLNKKLKALLNMTGVVVVRSVRMKRAAALLKTGRYTVAEVTYDVGLGDLRYFRKCFKQEFGVLPQAYKELHTKVESE